MTNEELGKIQDEITRHLEAFHLPSMHVTALAGLLIADVVTPSIRAAVEADRNETQLKIGRAFFEGVKAEREACEQLCSAIADDKHAQFKGRSPHAPNNDHRADTYTEGESSGAELCALAIRARSDAGEGETR